jgi:hypothetical protein
VCWQEEQRMIADFNWRCRKIAIHLTLVESDELLD